MTHEEIEANKRACTDAHAALWRDLPKGREGLLIYIERMAKLLAADLFSITMDGEKAARLLNEGVVTIAEKEIAFLANDPEIKQVTELMNALSREFRK